MTQRLSPLQIVVLPGWIQRAGLRNKLNTIDLLDYDKIKAFLSIDDMVEWFFLNDSFSIDKCFLANTFLEDAFNSINDLNPVQKTEIRNSVLPLSRSEAVAYSATAKLAGANPMSCCEYQFVKVDNTLFIILNEGFITQVSKSDYKNDFVKTYLKECYMMASIPEVSNLPLFNLYLKQFKN